MARISNSQRLSTLHAEAMAQFDRIQTALKDERQQCLQDRRFYSITGAQWEGPIGEQFANRPKLEVNKVALAVTRAISEYRNNRITVDFVSKDGTKDDTLADACDGLYRADEKDSGAEEAYDNAFEEAAGGGFGAWRLTTVYEDEGDPDDDRQRIRIEPIFDADSCVFFDLDAKRQDKADASCCYVLTAMTPEAYRAEWDEDPSTFPKDVSQTEFDWFTPDVVFVAEYYRVEEKSETIRIYRMLDGSEERHAPADFENDPELEERLLAIGAVEDRQRKIKRKRVRKYILSGAKVLEDVGYIAGNNIPIVPVYAKRWFVDSIERCMGIVRLAKDPQRLKNMQLSKLAEISALSSVEKPILTPEQIAGHQVMWAEDNLKNYPYLLINPITDQNGNQAPSPPVGYTRSSAIPPAMAALLQITEQDMQDVLGNQQNGEQMVSNVSGKAVEMIQNRLDTQTFLLLSNFAKGVRRSGEIWLGMARDVYIEAQRQMKSVGSQDEVTTVELQRPVIDDKGALVLQNDLSRASFDVSVDVGPTSSNKRASTVRALTSMMAISDDPETKMVLQAMALMNMEGEGIADIREHFRQKLLMMGVVKPTEEEAQKLAEMAQNQQPDPQAVYLQAAAEQALAEATKARADTVLTAAKAEQAKAVTLKTVAETDAAEQKQALEVIDRFGVNRQIGQPQGSEVDQLLQAYAPELQ